MAVVPEVSRAVLESEVEAVMELASTFGWIVCVDLEGLKLWVRMVAHNGDIFVVRMSFENYRQEPPAVEFVDPATGETGSTSCYPRGPDSFFNTSGPCICAPVNRRAYKLPGQAGGLHTDWSLGDWANSTAQSFRWAPYASAAGILTLIQSRLDRQNQYLGRMK